MDSAALAYWLKPDLAITVDYGQRPAAGEIRAARAVCAEIGIPHEIVSMDLRALGSGSLAGAAQLPNMVPEWWAFRNQLLITIAAMRTVKDGPGEVLIGSVSTDVVHADGRQLFFERMAKVLEAQEPVVRLSAPAKEMTSTDLILVSEIPLDILGWTLSCHLEEVGCGHCSGCIKHIEVLERLGRNGDVLSKP
jgi:7-cyano-7-deazaguanine synthase